MTRSFRVVRSLCAAIGFLGLACPGEATAQTSSAKYSAGFADGSVVSDVEIREWNAPAAEPHLAGRRFFDAGTPFRWARRVDARATATVPEPTAFVEFVGGDQLPCTVMGGRRDGELVRDPQPAHLVVSPSTSVNFPTGPSRRELRVSTAFVERIVWQAGDATPAAPGEVVLRDGRRVRFKAAQWGDRQLRLLVDSRTQTFAVDELAEMRFPERDAWLSLLSVLRVLSPDATGSLLQIETADGLRVTTSRSRFQVRSLGDSGNPENWIQLVQPAWSRDPLFLRHRHVLAWRCFSVDRIPATLLPLTGSNHSGVFSSAWGVARRNTNVRGQPLASGGQPWGWGFGVHASHELRLPAPPFAAQFRTGFGLDRAAGNGGSVRGRVLVGGEDRTPPDWNTPLVGSNRVVQTDWLATPIAGSANRDVALIADMASDLGSADVDPADLRDVCDWLEPEFQLPVDVLKTEFQKAALSTVPGFAGWSMSGQAGVDWKLANMVDGQAQFSPEVFLVWIPHPGPATVSRTQRVTKERPILVLPMFRPNESTANTRLEVIVNDMPRGATHVPQREQVRQRPRVLNLTEFVGRSVKIELKFIPESEQSHVVWLPPQWSAPLDAMDEVR